MHEYPIELRRKYVVSRELGTGACGTVKLGFHVDSDKHRYPVAIKIINKRMINSSSGRNDVVMNEAKILRQVILFCKKYAILGLFYSYSVN